MYIVYQTTVWFQRGKYIDLSKIKMDLIGIHDENERRNRKNQKMCKITKEKCLEQKCEKIKDEDRAKSR